MVPAKLSPKTNTPKTMRRQENETHTHLARSENVAESRDSFNNTIPAGIELILVNSMDHGQAIAMEEILCDGYHYFFAMQFPNEVYK